MVDTNVYAAFVAQCVNLLNCDPKFDSLRNFYSLMFSIIYEAEGEHLSAPVGRRVLGVPALNRAHGQSRG